MHILLRSTHVKEYADSLEGQQGVVEHYLGVLRQPAEGGASVNLRQQPTHQETQYHKPHYRQ
jgi:hypothetical protein